MNEIEVLAVFSTEAHAHTALVRLEDLRYRDVRATIAAQCAIRAAVSRQTQQRVTDTLRKLGALDVTSRVLAPQSNWMSHQNGAITGIGVEPGAGDSETGMPEDRRV